MKYAIFAFNGDPICFIHTVLNALDLKEKGHDILVVLEGSATALLKTFTDQTAPFYSKYQDLLKSGLIYGVCKACSAKMGTLKEAEELGLTLLDDMSGHPSMSWFLDEGYEILTL